MLGLIGLCDAAKIELISSEALLFEIERNLLPIRKEHALAVLARAKSFIPVSELAVKRAEYLMSYGIKPLDALHLALAELGNADAFCTCDDRLLRNVKQVKDLKVKSGNPVDLVQEMDQ